MAIPFTTIFFLKMDSCPEFIIEDTANYYRLHYFYLFAIMLFGAFLAQKKHDIKSDKYDLLKLFISAGVYYGYKGILIKYHLGALQLILPLFLIIVIYYAYKAANHIITASFLQKKQIRSFIVYISNLTLDIYIVQFVCIGYAKKFQFPLGYLVAIGLITISAILLNYSSKFIVNFLYTKLRLNK